MLILLLNGKAFKFGSSFFSCMTKSGVYNGIYSLARHSKNFINKSSKNKTAIDSYVINSLSEPVDHK